MQADVILCSGPCTQRRRAFGNAAVLVAELRAPGATFAQIAVIEDEMSLNDPLPTRYVNWLSGVTKGDFGISYKTGADVGASMSGRLSVTGTLLAGAAGFAILLSLGLGFLGATRPYGAVDTLTRALALVGASTPTFFLGAMPIYGFALALGWFPTFGYGSSLRNWILPWISLGMLPGCVLSRIVRVGLEEELTRPFALTARAKVLTRNTILFRDALPNIAPAYLNALGAQATAMTVGTVVIEPLIGLGLGTQAGYHHGWTDEVIMRVTDVALAMIGIFGTGYWT